MNPNNFNAILPALEPQPNFPPFLEIIPKFTLRLSSAVSAAASTSDTTATKVTPLPLPLHGSGTNTRRYLYASDATDAFDTILHRGVVGEIYNVDSRDEISNLELAKALLRIFGLVGDEGRDEDGRGEGAGKGESASGVFAKWIQHTTDRPFNDKRYAVDGRKLRALGWDQKVRLDEGLRETVRWYRRFGATWWGDVEHVIGTPFPVITGGESGGGAPAAGKRTELSMLT